jgi:hypothetical protein
MNPFRKTSLGDYVAGAGTTRAERNRGGDSSRRGLQALGGGWLVSAIKSSARGVRKGKAG